ncbi:hypothetical protein [Caballeronia sp. Sq4a]|uniref:hypothetical protein n=1 Tax=Caballeronia sp. Sq4a TaxID=2878152 RepID=UPI0020BE4315|nr:hypothetical protein [Caballeronia sp. Sq4a]
MAGLFPGGIRSDAPSELSCAGDAPGRAGFTSGGVPSVGLRLRSGGAIGSFDGSAAGDVFASEGMALA